MRSASGENRGIYVRMRGAWHAFIREEAVILRELNRKCAEVPWAACGTLDACACNNTRLYPLITGILGVMLCKTLDGRLAAIGRMAYTGRFWLNLGEKIGKAVK